jgi:hypothetical protein
LFENISTFLQRRLAVEAHIAKRKLSLEEQTLNTELAERRRRRVSRKEAQKTEATQI